MDVDTSGRYLAVDMIDDGLGTGVRIYTDHDEVYEAREVDGAGVRVYGRDQDWGVILNIPRTGLREGYDTFDMIAERLEDAYDADLVTPSATFLDSVKAHDAVSVESGPVTLQYLSEETDAGPEPLELPSAERSIGGYACAGAGTGAVTGATTLGAAGPEAALVGAAWGGVLGGVAGAFTAFNEPALHPYSPIGVLQKTKGAVGRRLQAYRDGHRLSVDRLGEESLWNTFNEKRRLDAVQETARDMERTLRYDELRESGIEEDVERLMEHHFQGFAARPGVTVRFTGSRYSGVLDLVGAALARDVPVEERPSIHTDREMFRSIFEAADEETRERLVDAVLESDDTDSQVEAYLEDHHGAMVEQVGQERALAGDAG